MRAVLAEYSSTVSPGIAGFLVTFGLALATWLLIRSMVGRIRRLRYTPDPAARPDPSGPVQRRQPPEQKLPEQKLPDQRAPDQELPDGQRPLA